MHWSRWGDPTEAKPLPTQTRELVDAFIGTRDQAVVDPEDVRLSDPLAPALVEALQGIVSPDHVLTDHAHRLARTRGKSTPDLLRMRSGDGLDSPDAVVRPGDATQVQAVVQWCAQHNVAVVPFGGGTSVVGGLAARREGYAGVISLDLVRIDRLLSVDEESMTATVMSLITSTRRALVSSQ